MAADIPFARVGSLSHWWNKPIPGTQWMDDTFSAVGGALKGGLKSGAKVTLIGAGVVGGIAGATMLYRKLRASNRFEPERDLQPESMPAMNPMELPKGPAEGRLENEWVNRVRPGMGAPQQAVNPAMTAVPDVEDLTVPAQGR